MSEAEQSPKKRRWGLIVLGVILFIIVFGDDDDPQKTTTTPAMSTVNQGVVEKSTVNQDVVARYLPMRPKCKSTVQQWQKAGIVGAVEDSGVGLVTVEFDESVWKDAIRKKKVAYALTIYCAHMPSDGKLKVILQGLREYSTLTYVIDGNYWEGF
jgi:hypothetical protein